MHKICRLMAINDGQPRGDCPYPKNNDKYVSDVIVVGVGPCAYPVFPPHSAHKGKNQTDYLLWEVCAGVANERWIILTPTMIIGDPGAEFSQKWGSSAILCWVG
jgi:hypothetical protein